MTGVQTCALPICSKRAEDKREAVKEHLLVTRYDPVRVERGEMLKLEDIREILAIPLLGVIPESESVLKASNTGNPVIMDTESPAGQAYTDAVGRFLGDERAHRFLEAEKKKTGLFGRLFGGRAA